MIAAAGVTIAEIGSADDCFLAAFEGDDPVGIAGLATEVDAALLFILFVVPGRRRRGVGARLLAGVREAAQARGVRRLYAVALESSVDFFWRSGFASVNQSEMVETFSWTSTWPQTGCGSQGYSVLRTDLSA